MAHHTRSISLPSRSHPLTLAVEEQLCRLRASSETISSSPSSILNLVDITDLYECVEDLLQMQHTQHALSDESVLNRSLVLLDICGIIRDVLLQMKQSAQDLQSSFRRRRGGELDLTNAIGAYLSSRKKINKVIRKSLRDIKRMNKCFFPLLDKDQHLVREVQATTLAVFESLLSFLDVSNAGLKQSSWSLVSKLMRTKHVACEGKVENLNDALNTLISEKQYKVEDVKNAQKPLEELEMSIQDLEDGLECVFRRLIKTRVSLLNILNQ